MRYRILLYIILGLITTAVTGEEIPWSLAKPHWQEYLQKYGTIEREEEFLPPRIIIDAKKFQSIPRGSTMNAVYLSAENAIYLRKKEELLLRHELAHLYLAWRMRQDTPILEENLARILSLRMSCSQETENSLPIDQKLIPEREINCLHKNKAQEILSQHK